MKKTWILAILMMGLLLAACNGDKPATTNNAEPASGGDITAENAETALRAIFTGDRQLANQYFCPAEQVTADTIAAYENAEIKSLSCERDDLTMHCAYQLSISAGQAPLELDEQVDYFIQDNKLCTPQVYVEE